MIRERYDPSLPHVLGDLDQLIQALLNIAKNAVEAVAGQDDGEIAISTSYRSGVSIARLRVDRLAHNLKCKSSTMAPV